MFPDEFEQFSNYVFKESSATSGGPEYNYDYGDTDDYEETIYPQCPHNCVRHSFCNLTGRYTIVRISRNSVALLPAKSANSDYNTYSILYPTLLIFSISYLNWSYVVCLLNPILCKWELLACLESKQRSHTYVNGLWKYLDYIMYLSW